MFLLSVGCSGLPLLGSGALPAASGRIERHGRVGIALQAPDLARRTVFANVMLALDEGLAKTIAYFDGLLRSNQQVSRVGRQTQERSLAALGMAVAL